MPVDFRGCLYPFFRMIRPNGKEYQIYTIDDIDYSVFQVKDGDALTAEAILDRFENKLEIKGAVYRPAFISSEEPGIQSANWWKRLKALWVMPLQDVRCCIASARI